MQPGMPVSLDLSPSAAPNGKLRLGSLKGEDRQKVFDAVIALYLSGPKLADIAQALGVGHRSLQRFMVRHDWMAWLEAQDLKQWERIDEYRAGGGLWNDHLFNSAGYRMDRIAAFMSKGRPVSVVTHVTVHAYREGDRLREWIDCKSGNGAAQTNSEDEEQPGTT